MNKILTTVCIILGILLVVFFFMWKNVSDKNTELNQQNQNLENQISTITETLAKKDEIIKNQDKKYQELINSIEYNECESLPVSPTLLDAAKELQK